MVDYYFLNHVSTHNDQLITRRSVDAPGLKYSYTYQFSMSGKEHILV